MKRKANRAFTLIELMVAIIIIGVLAGFIIAQIRGANDSAKDSKREGDIALIRNALSQYRSENYSMGPVESSACNIGGGCSNLDPVLKSVMGNIPTDPSGTSYSYQSSTGADCTITATLSNGDAYRYDCSTDSITTGSVVLTNGACGSSNGANLSSMPTANLCSAGNSSSVSGSGPWTWSCAGINGGSSASCATGSMSAVNGACGSSNGANLPSIPTANLCTAGVASTVSGSGPWTWSCVGQYSGTTASCSANIIVNGVCGSSNGANLPSIPTANLCTAGNSSTVSGSGPWTWSCAGLNTGTTASCSTGAVPVNGVCGSSNGISIDSAPSTNLCSAGDATTVSGSGPWYWGCNGLNGGTSTGSTACQANPYSIGRYRQPITISNSSGSSLANYQVKITVTYGSHMNSSFNDLRFTSSDGTTLIPYWVEAYTASSSATVWVNVPSIPTAGTTIYMYYGTQTSSASNVASTFDFYDDFTGTTFDSAKWSQISINGNVALSVSSSLLNLTAASSTWCGIGLVANNPLPLNDYIVEAYMMRSGGNVGGAVGLVVGLTQKTTRDTTYYGYYSPWAGFSIYGYTPYYDISVFNASTANPYTVASYGYWHKVSLKVLNSTGHTISGDTFNGNTYTIDSGGGSALTAMYPFVHYGDYGGGTSYVDWIRIRKYASVEPTSSFGSEQNGR